MKNVILLVMPADMDIYMVLIDNLKYHGFEVVTVIAEQKFHYPSLSLRMQTKFKQHILRQHDAKKQLICKMQIQQIKEKLNTLPCFDYAFFIRADLQKPEFINYVKNKTKNSIINFQWDGMNRYPSAWDIAPLFDRFFVFDSEDLQKNTTFLPATNFYFDHDLQQSESDTNDFYYMGSHQDDRLVYIKQFSSYAEKMNWKLKFYIYSDQVKHYQLYPSNNITIINQAVSLAENLNHAKHSRVLVDFVIGMHKGLSLRVFEALGYRKKLITTNATVRHYDFYHPNNIYILNSDNFDGIQGFLELPYIDIDPIIRQKYAFGNWIRYILNIEPFQSITLPTIEKII